MPPSGAEQSHDSLFKVLVVGDPSSGKSSLCNRIANDVYSSENNLIYATNITTDKTARLVIWEKPEGPLDGKTSHFYRGAAAVIIVYDTTSKNAFSNIRERIQELERHTNEGVVIMLAGTKADNSTDRQIELATARNFAEAHHWNLFETSAKENSNIENLFSELVHDLFSQKQEKIQNKVTNPPAQNHQVKRRSHHFFDKALNFSFPMHLTRRGYSRVPVKDSCV